MLTLGVQDRSLRNALCGLVLLASAHALTDAHAEPTRLPVPLQGPVDPDHSGYAHTSFVLPYDDEFELHYELCNRREANLAFRWKAAGFQLLDSAPLGPQLCALYQRSTTKFRRELDTVLEFSSDTVSAKAYVDCKRNPGGQCGSETNAEGKSSFAVLRAYLMPSGHRLDGATVVEPLYITASMRDNKSLGHKISVEWVATRKRFIVGISGATTELLDKSVKGPIATFHSYEKFRELDGNPLSRGFEKIDFIEVSGVDEEKGTGGWQADIESELAIDGGVLLGVIDDNDRLVALMEIPVP